MKANKKTQYEKTMRKLERTYYKLSSGRRGDSDYIWVPSEDPKHIGWETTIVMSDLLANSKDGPHIKKVLELTKLDQPHFFSHEYQNLVKGIRASGKRYKIYRAQWFEYQRKTNPDRPASLGGVKEVESVKVSLERFKEFPDEVKKYFVHESKYWPATISRDAYFEKFYKLGSWRFPDHELRIKLVKAYSTVRGIPKSIRISERTKIDEKLTQEMWWDKRYGDRSGRKYEHTRGNHSRRKAWNAVCKVATPYYKFPDSIIEEAPGPFIEDVIDELAAKKVKYKI